MEDNASLNANTIPTEFPEILKIMKNIDQNQDNILIKSGAGRTLVLVKKGGVTKGKLLCDDVMNIDLTNIEKLELLKASDINEVDCNKKENQTVEDNKTEVKNIPTVLTGKRRAQIPVSGQNYSRNNSQMNFTPAQQSIMEIVPHQKEVMSFLHNIVGGGTKKQNKKIKRDKLGRFIKRKTRKSSGGWLF